MLAIFITKFVFILLHSFLCIYQVKNFTQADTEYGSRIAEELKKYRSVSDTKLYNKTLYHKESIS